MGFSLLFVEKISLPGQGDVFKLTNLITLQQVFRGGSCVGGLEKANTGVCRESTL